MIKTPYLLFLGDAPDALAAKVAQGIKDWRPDASIGQLRMSGCKADMGLPEMSLESAKEAKSSYKHKPPSHAEFLLVLVLTLRGGRARWRFSCRRTALTACSVAA